MKKEQLVKLFKCVSLLNSINDILILNDLIEIENFKIQEAEQEKNKELDPPKILVLKRKYYGR